MYYYNRKHMKCQCTKIAKHILLAEVFLNTGKIVKNMGELVYEAGEFV